MITHTYDGTVYIAPRPETKLFSKQVWTSSPRKISKSETLKVHIRFDDECRNHHNTFAIEGEIWEDDQLTTYGGLRDQIAFHFPHLAHLLKWQSFTAPGKPVGYPDNAVYHAGLRDCHGRLAGEQTCIHGEFAWEAVNRPDERVYSATPPEPVVVTYVPYINPRSGKERELDYARTSAFWWSATDEELCDPNLKDVLMARLPEVQAHFKRDLEATGLLWEPIQGE